MTMPSEPALSVSPLLRDETQVSVRIVCLPAAAGAEAPDHLAHGIPSTAKSL